MSRMKTGLSFWSEALRSRAPELPTSLDRIEPLLFGPDVWNPLVRAAILNTNTALLPAGQKQVGRPRSYPVN